MDFDSNRIGIMISGIHQYNNIYINSINELENTVIKQLNPSSLIVIADDNTVKSCVPLLGDIIEKDRIITIASGEENKNIESCKTIWSELIRMKTDRQSLILNVGGGMICDLGGFAASCYQRGIRFGHIPTTVLAMGDASIGGKTGVDYLGLKNYIGIIRLPEFIWIDEHFLLTLPVKEKISGLSEIVKHAIIGSNDLWSILQQIGTIDEVPWRAVFDINLPFKLRVVEEDPFENGVRKILNYGHTVGHALESYFLDSGNPVMHGDCVATGMLVEAKISNAIGLLNNNDFEGIVKLIQLLLAPVRNSLPTFAALSPWIGMDKKKANSQIGFSLPDRIGSCRWDIQVKESVVAESFIWFTQGWAT